MVIKSSFQTRDAGRPLRVLFAASEAVPYIKTGGLADVAGSLPLALHDLGLDARLILPAYPIALERARPYHTVASLRLPGVIEPIRVVEALHAGRLPVYLVEIPGAFDRQGNPYSDVNGHPWGDNAWRFALFCRVIVTLAMGRAGIPWQPDVLHLNDWQTGLVPPLLAGEGNRPATIFTIHNLAYQGIYDLPTFDSLHLPRQLWSPNGVEFHGSLSFIKGGLAFADWITTVSPTYAEEICHASHAYGMEGLLNHRSDRLTGVLNGIDYAVWDPATDPHIPHHYDMNSFARKRENKLALQQELGLEQDADALLFGHIGRMVEQKGVDMIAEIIPGLVEKPHVQIAILGSGDRALEQRLHGFTQRYPGRAAEVIGYNEALAHRIEAGADIFLMPSRFEPCGLNQLYSLRYGTVPLVHRTGGLADTVVDCTPISLLDGTATGFVFDHPDATGLWHATERAIEYFRRPSDFRERLAVNGMRQDFSWTASARHYLDIYHAAIDQPAPNPIA